MAGFPPQREGVFYLAEGGQETEIMYKFGYDLPQFAMFTLLDELDAVAEWVRASAIMRSSRDKQKREISGHRWRS